MWSETMFKQFDLRHEEHGSASDVSVVGELDIASASQLRRVIGDLMGAGIRVVTVDLSDTDFVDSSGLGALLWADHRLRQAGGGLTVVNPHHDVLRTIQLAGLDGLLH